MKNKVTGSFYAGFWCWQKHHNVSVYTLLKRPWSAICTVYETDESEQLTNKNELYRYEEEPQDNARVLAYLTSLHRCKKLPALCRLNHFHSLIIKDSFEKIQVLQDALVQAYSRCGACDEARNLFDQILRKNDFSWALLIGAHGQVGQFDVALQIFKQMCIEGFVVTKPVVVSLLSSWHEGGSKHEAKFLHTCISRMGLNKDVIVATTLVNMYNYHNNSEYARRVFDDLADRDVVLWTTLLATYVQHGYGAEAFFLFHQMLMEGVMPNEFTFSSILGACNSEAFLIKGKSIQSCVTDNVYNSDIVLKNALINMYAQCGNIEDSTSAFNDVLEPNTVSWSAMMTAFAKHGEGMGALVCLRKMYQRGFFPDLVAFISAFDACANGAAINEGKQLHLYFLNMKLDFDVNLSNAILNMYARCGFVKKASMVFDMMPHWNVITWTTMIASYALQGLAVPALELACRMIQSGVYPNSITIVNLLCACSHGGFLEEACQCFALMKCLCLTPTVEHYNCIIDLLVRVGMLEEGEILLKGTPFKSSPTLWTTLLGGCKLHVDVDRAVRAAANLLQLEEFEAVPYILLQNIYSADITDEDVLLNHMYLRNIL